MEWVFVLAVVVLLGAKIFLARGQYRQTRQQARRDLDAGGDPGETPDHLPGHGDGGSGDR